MDEILELYKVIVNNSNKNEIKEYLSSVNKEIEKHYNQEVNKVFGTNNPKNFIILDYNRLIKNGEIEKILEYCSKLQKLTKELNSLNSRKNAPDSKIFLKRYIKNNKIDLSSSENINQIMNGFNKNTTPLKNFKGVKRDIDVLLYSGGIRRIIDTQAQTKLNNNTNNNNNNRKNSNNSRFNNNGGNYTNNYLREINRTAEEFIYQDYLQTRQRAREQNQELMDFITTRKEYIINLFIPLIIGLLLNLGIMFTFEFAVPKINIAWGFSGALLSSLMVLGVAVSYGFSRIRIQNIRFQVLMIAGIVYSILHLIAYIFIFQIYKFNYGYIMLSFTYLISIAGNLLYYHIENQNRDHRQNIFSLLAGPFTITLCFSMAGRMDMTKNWYIACMGMMMILLVAMFSTIFVYPFEISIASLGIFLILLILSLIAYFFYLYWLTMVIIISVILGIVVIGTFLFFFFGG